MGTGQLWRRAHRKRKHACAPEASGDFNALTNMLLFAISAANFADIDMSDINVLLVLNTLDQENALDDTTMI